MFKKTSHSTRHKLLQKSLIFMPIETMEQNKLLLKAFNQTFQFTESIPKIVQKPFSTKKIPEIFIHNSTLQIKQKTQ